jgi:hypothetical protein
MTLSERVAYGFRRGQNVGAAVVGVVEPVAPLVTNNDITGPIVGDEGEQSIKVKNVPTCNR